MLKHSKRILNRSAKTYSAAAVLPREVGIALCERLDIIRLKPQTILDIGAGTGFISHDLQQRYSTAQVIAMDLALLRLQEIASKTITKICADAHTLPLANDCIDLLVSNLCLSWFQPKLDSVFKEWLRVLKPGGTLLFTCFGPDTLAELKACFRASDDFIHVPSYIDMHDIGDSLTRSGWQDPVLDVEHFTLTYANVKQLMQDLKLQGLNSLQIPARKTLTGKMRWQRMIKAYEKHRIDERIPAHVEITFGYAIAPLEKNLSDNLGEVAIPLNRLRRRGIKSFDESL